MAQTPSPDFFDELNKREQEAQVQKQKDAELSAINKAGIKNVEATNRTTDAVTKGAADIKAGVRVTNPDLAKTQDVNQAVDAIHKLNLTTFNTNQGLPQLADNLVKLTEAVQTLQKDYESKGVAGLSKQLAELVTKLDGVSKVLNDSKVQVDKGLQDTINNLQKSIDAIDFNPTVSIKAPATKVVTTPVDLQPVVDALSKVEEAITNDDDEPLDLGPVVQGLASVQDAIANQKFPVPNYVLPYLDANGKAVQVQLDSQGNVPTTATISGSVSVSTQPTYKDDPTNGAETPKFGKTNSATHKQQVEAQLQNSSGTEIGTNTNPVKVDPTGTTTQPVSISGVATASNQTGGSQKTQIVDGSGNVASVSTTDSDGTSGAGNRFAVVSHFKVFNGTTWDRVRSGITGAVSSLVGYINTINVGKYNATPPTLSNGQAIESQVDQNGNLKGTQATKLAGEDLAVDVMKVEQRFSYTNITTNATTVIKSSPGFIHAFTINNPSALTTTALTMTVYDNTAGSGTKIGTWTVPAGQTSALPIPPIEIDVTALTGITVVTAGPAVAADITVSWR